jgi:hypothetical protein
MPEIGIASRNFTLSWNSGMFPCIMAEICRHYLYEDCCQDEKIKSQAHISGNKNITFCYLKKKFFSV